MTLTYAKLKGLIRELVKSGYIKQVSTKELEKHIAIHIGCSKYILSNAKDALKTTGLLCEISVNVWEFPDEKLDAEDEKIIKEKINEMIT
jgi:hypothetical protein